MWNQGRLSCDCWIISSFVTATGLPVQQVNGAFRILLRGQILFTEALISHVMSRDLFTSNTVTLYLNKGHPFPKVEWKQTAAHSGTTLGGVTDFYSVHIEICSVLSFSSIRQALFPCYFYFKRTQPKLYANPFKGVNTQVSPRIKWTEFTSVAATLSLGLLDEDLQMNKTENPFLPHCSTGREKVG